MKRLLTTAIILMALLMTSLAQSSKWNSYRSYYDVSHIEPAGNKVFVLASNSMFSYNLNDQTIDEYMQSNGLSSNIISRIAWCSAAKQLFIVYDDYNFDFLDTEGNIVNIASYKTKYTTEDKTINDIYIDGVYAYLATAFGVMKINLRNKVIDLEVKCGEKGRLYGSVTAAEVAEALEKQHGVQVDKRKIDIGDSIREVGVRDITVWLYSGVTTPMKLNVQPLKK